MKTRTLLSLLILVFAALIVVGSCATMKSPDKMVYERFCGTWVNTEYEGKDSPAVKEIYNPDGTCTTYSHLHETTTYSRGAYSVEKRWSDSEGNSWYHVKMTWPIEPMGTGYLLFKLDKYNSILEYNYSGTGYPTEVDPKDKHTSYRIYYRY
jgi:hypothetical protein